MKPRIIIHGGAGNITHDNLPPALYTAYRTSLLRILKSSYALLQGEKGADAITVAVHAVKMLEEDPLFNSAHGAVFTKSGTNELEASIMTTRHYLKRGCAVSNVTRVKSPITLAAEMLRRGNEAGAGGAQGHVHLSGAECERLAGEWGVELCDASWFWTRKRWEQHLGGGEGIEPPPKDGEGEGEGEVEKEGRVMVQESLKPDGTPWPADDPAWDGREYIPKGTVGCVVMDHTGTLAVATSTGGLTNKLPGRIGDTPTFGAGFWAEEWLDSSSSPTPSTSQPVTPTSTSLPPLSSLTKYNYNYNYIPPTSPLATLLTQTHHHLSTLTPTILNTFRDCFGSSSSSSPSPSPFPSPIPSAQPQPQPQPQPSTPSPYPTSKHRPSHTQQPHAIALGSTGNGDSFLRLSAASTVASAVRFNAAITVPSSISSTTPTTSLQTAISYMADPNGQLQQSAGSRWGGLHGEGEGGMIGIEMVNGEGKVCFGFNKAMWRTWVDDGGVERCMVFRDEY